MEITEARTREDMINNLKANGNYSKFKQNMAASRKAYSERMANYKISKSKENASDLKVEWKLIEGFDGIYSVSNYGEVRNNRTGKLMKPSKNEKGYLHINLMKNGKRKNMRINRLVAQVFIPNPENKPQVNHIDFNRANNCVSNLEWVTGKENCSHSAANYSKAKKGKIIMKNKKLHHIEVMSNGFRVTICSRRKWFKHLEDAISYRDEELKKYV